MMFYNKKISLFWVGLISGVVFFTFASFHYFVPGHISLATYLQTSVQEKVPGQISLATNLQSPVEEKVPPKVDELEKFNSPTITQDNPLLIKTIRTWIDNPSKLAYNLSHPLIRDFSLGQSPLVDRIFKRKRNGFFIECGAMDGEGRSNTLFLERDRGWGGILIEGNILNYEELKVRNRKAHAIHACASIKDYPQKVNFNLDTNMGRVFQGKKDFEWAKQNKRKVNLAPTQCFPLYSILLAMNQTTVDYFSLDVEGNELDVLKTIPFDKLDIKTMSVEILHGPGRPALRAFLESKGYKEIVYKEGERIVDWDIVVQKRDM